MAILGVLLGITMCVLAGSVWYGYRELSYLRGERDLAYEANADTRVRLKDVEKEVAYLSQVKAAEPVAEDPKPKHMRMRAWNEDAVVPEESK